MRVSGTAGASPNAPFRPFCDGCGSRFGAGQLRPVSKFCSYCGATLSPWTVRQLALQTPKPSPTDTSRTPQRPSVYPADEEPVCPVGGIAGRRSARRRLLSSSSEDDLPVTQSRAHAARQREERQVGPSETSNHPESPSRAKRARGRINYSIHEYYQKMMRTCVPSNPEPSSKRARTEPSTRTTVARVHPRSPSEADRQRSRHHPNRV
jgi:hypothetical protein